MEKDWGKTSRKGGESNSAPYEHREDEEQRKQNEKNKRNYQSGGVGLERVIY